MQEVDKILYKMGYYDADPHKKQEVQDSIDASEEFMRASGVPAELITSKRAYAVKAIYADAVDKGTPDEIVKKDGMIVALISQMRR
jgi:hypothetical protein